MKMRDLKLFIFVPLLSLMLFAGCAGYKLGNIQSGVMRDVKTIYVPTVKNFSYEPGLPTLTTNAILRRIDNDGTFKSARSRGADGILEVTIVNVKRNSLRRSRGDLEITEEYELVVEAEATFTNLRTGTRMFTNQKVSGKTVYFVQNNLQEGERQSLPLAVDDLAYNLIKLLSEGW
jgi:hypothetical protein